LSQSEGATSTEVDIKGDKTSHESKSNARDESYQLEIDHIRTKLSDFRTELEAAKRRLAIHKNAVTRVSLKSQEVVTKRMKNEEELKELRAKKKKIEADLKRLNALDRKLKAECIESAMAVIPHQKERERAQFEVNDLTDQMKKQEKLLVQAGKEMELSRIKDPTMRALLRSEVNKTADSDDEGGEAAGEKPKEFVALQPYIALQYDHSRQRCFNDFSITKIRRLHQALAAADSVIKKEASTAEGKCKVEFFVKVEPEYKGSPTKIEQIEAGENDESKHASLSIDRMDETDEDFDVQTLLSLHEDFELACQKLNDFDRRKRDKVASIKRSAEAMASSVLEDGEDTYRKVIKTAAPDTTAVSEQPRDRLKRKRAEDDESDHERTLKDDMDVFAFPRSDSESDDDCFRPKRRAGNCAPQ
jgi:hypothetical protein